MEFTNEMLEKAKRAESAEALLALAKENGLEMTMEGAEAYFAQLHKSGELSDEELENVSGGGCHVDGGYLLVTAIHHCNRWKCRENWANTYYGRCKSCNYNDCKESPKICDKCYYCKYDGRRWLCHHPAKMKH